MKARGYWSTLNQIAVSGPWAKVDASYPTMLELQWNSFTLPFGEKAQCAELGYPLDFLL